MYITDTRVLVRQLSGKPAALCAFNANNADMAVAIVEESEYLHKPVIVQLTVQTLDLYYWHPLVGFIIDMVKTVKTPIALHLDHAKKVSDAMRAAQMGFSSVMYDGSSLPYKENMENTRELVEYCHKLGVSVEGEIGHVGSGTDVRDTSMLTDAKDASSFVGDTGVDMLAVAIGNVHGIPAGEAELDVGLAGRIAGETGVPLVLHGASGLGDDLLARAVEKGGMVKMNFATDLKNAWMAAQVRGLDEGAGDPRKLVSLGRTAVREAVRKKVAAVCR